ncbi:unnamed protein product [Parnassius apollo]|uniref:(apollo) hypothetical protein n=1 Tax=Parnassius apollo TaxID=110799 RepID=A0A8S3X7T4_PARAO|nr:unnamed protein product [Parnassius apollo]
MPLHFLFLDLQKAFDSVSREMIWWALRSKLVPETYVEIVRDIYRNSDSIVRTAVGDTTPLPHNRRLASGLRLKPYLFSVILDELSASVQKLPQPWLLMYADGIALVYGNKGRLTRPVHAWREALESGGLKLNVAKMEYMACLLQAIYSVFSDLTSLRVGDNTVESKDNFRYLGSVLDASRDIDRDMKVRISAAWAKWREVTGVICDPKMTVKLKGQVYKTVIMPVLTYGSVVGLLLERHRQFLHVTEMNMLWWMLPETNFRLIQNKTDDDTVNVICAADRAFPAPNLTLATPERSYKIEDVCSIQQLAYKAIAPYR